MLRLSDTRFDMANIWENNVTLVSGVCVCASERYQIKRRANSHESNQTVCYTVYMVNGIRFSQLMDFWHIKKQIVQHSHYIQWICLQCEWSNDSYVRTSFSVICECLRQGRVAFSLIPFHFFSPHASPNEYSSTWHAWAVGYGHLATFMFLLYDPPDLTYIYTNIMKFQFFYHDRLPYAVVLSLFLSSIKNSHNFSTSVCGIVEFKWHRRWTYFQHHKLSNTKGFVQTICSHWIWVMS